MIIALKYYPNEGSEYSSFRPLQSNQVDETLAINERELDRTGLI